MCALSIRALASGRWGMGMHDCRCCCMHVGNSALCLWEEWCCMGVRNSAPCCAVPQAPSGTAKAHGSAAATPHAGRWRR